MGTQFLPGFLPAPTNWRDNQTVFRDQVRSDTMRECWGKEGNQGRLGLSEIMWHQQTGALNQQTHVLVGCISQVLWKCGCWELNMRGQQHTTLSAQSRASWRSEIVIWEGRGNEAQTTDETHSYRKGWALWLQWHPLWSQQTQWVSRKTHEKYHEVQTLCISPLPHTKNNIRLGLM